jgi:hypothetical protein
VPTVVVGRHGLAVGGLRRPSRIAQRFLLLQIADLLLDPSVAGVHLDPERLLLARPALLRHVKRLPHRLSQLLDVLHQPVVLGDRLRDADDVGLLKGVAPHHRPRDLAGDSDHRGVVHVRRGQTGHQVGCPGTGGGDAHTGPAAGSSISVRRMSRGLLVPHQHVAEAGILGQGVIERHDRPAGVAEEDVDALVE